MQEAFRLGGWGMYPTLFVGAVLVILAARYALNPARGRLPVVVALGVLALTTSCLGFVTGVINTTTNPQLNLPRDGEVIAIGIGESLVNIAFGLCWLVLAGIAVVIGLSRRGKRSGASELVDPHAT